MKIAVLGGGSWATALIKILSEKAVSIKWWMRDTEAIEKIKKFKHNPDYLSSVELNLKKVKPSPDLEEVIRDSDWVIAAIPAAFLALALEKLPKDFFKNKKIVSGVKGLIPDSNLLVTDYFNKHYGVPKSDLLAIAGPCHAEEIALEKHSFLTIACEDLENADTFARQLQCRFVNASCIADLDGAEYAAILKNIVALACGISHGLGSGDNFQAVLVSNAMIEIEEFLSQKTPLKRQINRSGYLGDLLVTCYSQFSRNRTFGKMIGKGYSVKTAQIELKMIAEGYYATKGMFEIYKNMNVEMPILAFVHEVLYENKPLKQSFELLKHKLV
jgi:glycerol-3-phosphate dehydrogenase (NAD(P)+)